jgi:F-type H+-transporting ATPase subunit delta
MTYAFLSLYKAKQGIKTVTVTSVEKISKSAKKAITDLVKKHYKADIELIEETNKDLIGGFVLRIDDEQFDASVVYQLEKLKREFVN